MINFQDYIVAGVQVLQQIAEMISIAIIGVGIIVSLYHLLRRFRLPDISLYNRVRFEFSGYLVMALEFELASDILGTLISPSWDQLGRLAVIAAIRTFLSYFLQREISTEKTSRWNVSPCRSRARIIDKKQDCCLSLVSSARARDRARPLVRMRRPHPCHHP